MKTLSVEEYAKLMKVHPQTVYNWIKGGKVKYLRVGRKYSIIIDQDKNPQEVNKNTCILYARVSGHNRKDLENQLNLLESYAISNGYRIIDKIFDMTSSFNFKRQGLDKLFGYVFSKKIDTIIIYSPDRLTRLGFDLIENICNRFDVTIISVNNDKIYSEWQIKDITEELISFIHYITSKIYGHRSYKKRLKKLKEELKL